MNLTILLQAVVRLVVVAVALAAKAKSKCFFDSYFYIYLLF
jgi:hypothetical protein